MEKLIKIAVFFGLLAGVLCDCPISAYPRRTTLGFINAQINNDPSLHNLPSDYSYTLSQQLTSSTINVAVGLVGLELNAYGRLDFNVQYLNGTSLTTLKFRVRLISQNCGWRSLRFSFFASQSPLFQAGTISSSAFSSGGGEKGKVALYRAIPNYLSVQIEPVIRVFLSGATMKAAPLDEEYNEMIRQFESFKKFSTSGALVKYFSEAIEIKKALQLKISDVKILGRLYTFSIESNGELTCLGHSFIIFSRKNYMDVHGYISDTFGFLNANEYKFSSLQNMDMLMTGLTGIKLPKQDYYSFNLGINNLGGQSVYSINTNFRYLDTSFAYIAFEMKQAYVCQQCTNSPFIYENKMCVERCPLGFSVVASGGALFCDRCEIDKLKVVDTQSGQCVCAKRHFLDKAADTCRPCNYDCMTCDSSTRCLTCDNNMLQTKRVLAIDGKCKCPSIGYYDDKNAEDIVCQKCNPKCLTCDGPLLHDCLTCEGGKERDSIGFCVCKNGFVEDSYGSCLCPQPRRLNSKGICLDESTTCRDDQVPQLVDLTRRCVCKQGYYTVLNDCIKCTDNSVFNPESLKCECQKPTVYKNGLCQYCGPNETYDEILKICTCKDGTYEKSDGSCVYCPPKMILLNDNCECAFNYYEDALGVCKRCRRETDGPKCKRNLY